MKRTAKSILFVLTVMLLLSLSAFPAYADQDDSIIIKKPEAGETLRANTEYEIEWEVPAFFTLNLAYTTDGGATWNEIVSGNSTVFSREDSYTWTVPDIAASKVTVRLTILRTTGSVIITSYNDSGEFSISKFAIVDIIPLDPGLFIPPAPSNLAADRVSSGSVELSWEDKSINETGFKIERATGSGSFSQIASPDDNVEEYTDNLVAPQKTYRYRIRAYNSLGYSDYSDVLLVDTPAAEEEEEEEEEEDGISSVDMLFTIGSTHYQLNGTTKSMDVAPIIRQSRTLLPILYVADPLGAQVTWNSIEKKVTVKKPGKTIELWINNNIAKVNGTSVMIDTSNSNVTPVIIPPGRTMLPLRFIADNLDCDVLWNPADKSITVTYPE